jgi:phosphopantothenoylcysteine decarboxylase/phosphopantothenate--cysteine ligase
MDLKGKKIVLGITGSIAAYKSAFLVRELVKNGAEVKVIMTKDATSFISPLTLATLSKNPVYSEFVKNENGEWVNHVDLGLWADCLLIAPLTASTLSKMATGQSDNLLCATYLSAKCPVFVAPAMDLDMYQHPSTKENLKTLKSHNVRVIDSTFGELASGLIGEGRMAEPEDITSVLNDFFNVNSKLKGKNILITAGPTQEAIDPVRYIGNRSSGKMGYAIANKLAQIGANVFLVSGPSNLEISHANIELFKVNSADEMYKMCSSIFDKVEVAIMSAAVADFTPITTENQKIKKEKDTKTINIELTKTKDILAELGSKKKKNQLIIGFALETENGIENAKKKLKAKNADVIVLNVLSDEGAGFGHDTNKVTIITAAEVEDFELKSKQAVASDIVSKIESLL